MLNNHLEIRPMSGSTGAEIGEVDLGGALSDATIAGIRSVLADYGVVVFRDQTLTPEQHIAVARRFSGWVQERAHPE